MYFLISQVLNSYSDAVYSAQHAAAVAAVSRPNFVQRSTELCVHVGLCIQESMAQRYSKPKSFAARVVNEWNSLPDHVADVNSLKHF